MISYLRCTDGKARAHRGHAGTAWHGMASGTGLLAPVEDVRHRLQSTKVKLIAVHVLQEVFPSMHITLAL
jgi:hypothetical protein